jgi:hypothetical protein
VAGGAERGLTKSSGGAARRREVEGCREAARRGHGRGVLVGRDDGASKVRGATKNKMRIKDGWFGRELSRGVFAK